MQIRKKYLSDLTTTEKKQVRNLTVESSYGMYELLKAVRKNPEKYEESYIFMCYQGNKLIAWSAIAPATFTWTEKTELWVYCRKKFRRQGIASILYKLAKRKLARDRKRNTVAPWDDKGYAFFKSQGLRV